MSNNKIIIKPIKVTEYTCKQSKHSVVPRLSLRGILLAPSGSGKTVLLSNMMLNIYIVDVLNASTYFRLV